jgi:hypothetical protein
MNKTKLRVMLLLAAVLGTTTIAFSFGSERHIEEIRSESGKQSFQAVASPTPVEGQRRFPDDDRVRASSLSGGLRPLLAILGDRLTKAGKERVTYAGTLQRAGEDRASNFTLTWELPGRLRFEDFGRQQVTTFDGQTVTRTEAGANAYDDELLETLIFDSAEHLFVSQLRGAATRSLGSRFRLTEDSRAEYSGPFYDIFEVTEASPIRQEVVRQTRQYLFDSDTQALELVKYRGFRNDRESAVEVRLENWQRAEGQLFPRRIVRLENGAPVITLTVSSISVGPWVDDGFPSQAPLSR